MGLTKQYLRYSPAACFGVIASPTTLGFLPFRKTNDRFLVTSACENVYVWDTRTSEKVLTLEADKHEVTTFTSHQNQIAVGYSDGTVRIFNISTGECTVTFNGHKSGVTCLEFNDAGVCLVSGSKDTDIIMWDVVNESGLFRLKGHKGVITRCHFMKTANVLISSSKDSLIKFWDLDTQHCFKTVVGHRSEVWDFVLLRNDTRMITGAADSELRVFSIEQVKKSDESESEKPDGKKMKEQDEQSDSGDTEDANDVLMVTKIGSIMREGKKRVSSIRVDDSERLLGCHGPDNILEIFKLCTEKEVKKRVQNRLKKERKRMKSEGEEQPEVTEAVPEATLSDEIRRLTPIQGSSKVCGFDVVVNPNGSAKIAILLSNNSVQVFSLNSLEKESENVLEKSLKSQGHRSDVRTLAFSSDNVAVLSASGESAKVWNRESQKCICTTRCEYALCSSFAPGDRHYIIGTKTGKLQIFDLSAGALLEDIEAHSGPLWSICLIPDQRGIVSGSEDKCVKFWEFDLVKDEEYSTTTKRLTLVHTRTLSMSEGVICVKISPDQRLLAVSLLDCTVKIFFVDTLKFFLSLYDNSLPFLTLDISYDSRLIATGSADKKVKIWGLDFGDCHGSLSGHMGSVMCLQFIPKTHMLFSGGKDNAIKQWDADTCQNITTLQGHHGDIWALAVSPDGRHLVSASHDKSVRLWKKTNEILVLEEEQEMEREAVFEKGMTEGETVIPGETNKETGLAAMKTLETIKATEKLMEALNVYKEEVLKLEEHKQECKARGKELPAPTPNPLMTVYNTTCPLRYMLEVFRRIKSSELEQSLLTLQFDYVIQLLNILSEFLDKGWEVELTSRSLFFLLRVHHGQISASKSLLHIIDKLRTSTIERLSNMKDVVGFNLAGLTFLQREIDASSEVALFVDATHRFREKKKRKKKLAVPILAV